MWKEGFKIKLAIFPGRFDPLNNGQLDVIKKASKIFDKIIVLVTNSEDEMFSVKTRLRFIKSAISNFSNVETDHWAKQLDEYVKITHAKIIIKGITTSINLQNELNSNIVNETINEDVHFVFIMPNPKNMYINSELVKNLCFLKKNLNSVVPKCIEKEVKEEV